MPPDIARPAATHLNLAAMEEIPNLLAEGRAAPWATPPPPAHAAAATIT
ncbi:hypothetical protein [Hymenobacter nivis]|nr:hypothetical protein [Hymenobacter nivis]